MHRVEQALKAVPKWVDVILLGDLNVSLRYPRDKREEDLLMAFPDRGLVDMIDHFLPQRRYRGDGL